MEPVCMWTQDGMSEYDSFWESDCRNAFQFNEGSPKDNGFKFCPYCGSSIEIIIKQTDDVENDSEDYQ